MVLSSIVAVAACGPSKGDADATGMGSSGAAIDEGSTTGSSSTSDAMSECADDWVGDVVVDFAVCVDAACDVLEPSPWRVVEPLGTQRPVSVTCDVGVSYADGFGATATRLEHCDGDVQPLAIQVRVLHAASTSLSLALGQRVRLLHLTSRGPNGIELEDVWTLRDESDDLLAFSTDGAALPSDALTTPLRLLDDEGRCFLEFATYCYGEDYRGQARVQLEHAEATVGREYASIVDDHGRVWRLGARVLHHVNYYCGATQFSEFAVSGVREGA